MLERRVHLVVPSYKTKKLPSGGQGLHEIISTTASGACVLPDSTCSSGLLYSLMLPVGQTSRQSWPQEERQHCKRHRAAAITMEATVEELTHLGS
jgi:hypothetical protein